jgi:GT2 family glycosyltransferase
MQPVASIVITSRGRRDDLRRALQSCRTQTGVTVETLVFDDASTDGSAGMVESEFPEVRCFRNQQQVGYITLRNQGFREAHGEFVFSIDDDAWFSDPDIVRSVVEEFQRFPETAAFALRYAEPNQSGEKVYMEPLANGAEVRNFVGCSHAIRREAALAVGGYRELLVHQGEERDLCVRLRQSGHAVRYLRTPHIVHEPSPSRDFRRWHYYGIRNTLLFDVLNVPLGALIPRLLVDAVFLFRHAAPRCGLAQTSLWLLRSFAACARYWPLRQPVSWQSYRLYRSLPSAGASPISEVNSSILPLSNVHGAAAT